MASGESGSPARSLRKLLGAAIAAVLLRRAFNSSKCKTEAKMATARMKLLRNRREAQVRQMRRDIAALLLAGQEDTARIRVEHVIREQNIMAANEIIAVFCELIVTRLPIITKQKECPADLKEGICSLIFAAPRCSETPELGRIRDIFEKKYGKDFVSAATDLRPNSGVNCLLVEKLSVKKPSGEVKLKVLKEIAKEHQVEWDISETEQALLKPPEELIQGPSSFVEASKMPVKNILLAQNVQPSPVNCSSQIYDANDNGGTMQFKDAASAARAAAKCAERAASAAKAAADLSKQNTHPFDELEDSETSDHQFTHSSRKQSMTNSAQSSRKEDSAFDELKSHRKKVSSSESFSGSNRMEDKDRDPEDLDTRRIRRRNAGATRKVHSDIKFDDSEGLNSETEDDGSDMEIESVERQPYQRYNSGEKEPDYGFSDLPKASLGSRVHPKMPLDYETLTARFEALKSGKLP